MRGIIYKGCAAVVSAVLLSSSGVAAPVANVGTLTCTLTPSTKQDDKADHNASCTFDGLTGRKASFVGTVKRHGEETETSNARIVLIWSVQAPTPEIPLEAIEGEYVGLVAPKDDTAAPTSLRGGRDDDIELVPLTPEPGALPGATLSVLRLSLSTMRT